MKPKGKVNHKVGFFLTKCNYFRSINVSYFLLKQDIIIPAFIVSIFFLTLFHTLIKKFIIGVCFGVRNGVILIPVFRAIILQAKHENKKITNTKEKLC
jgi:hypothetical protein